MNTALHEYFQKHSERVRHCYFVPVVRAEHVHQDQEYQGGFAEIFEKAKAPFDGYLVYNQYGPDVMSTGEFEATYERVDQWLKKTPRSPMEDHIIAQPVSKDAMITVHPLERSNEIATVPAPTDGWVVHNMKTERVRFMDDLTFRSIYDCNAQPMEGTHDLYRPKAFDRSVKIRYVNADKDLLVRDEKGVPHCIEEGSFIVQLPESMPREYMTFSPKEFFTRFSLAAPFYESKDAKHDTKVVRVDFTTRTRRTPK